MRRSRRELAKDGYLVVSIDYRHAPQSRWPAQIDDVRAAIDWVVAHAGENGGDSQHIGLLGRSSGAQLALVAAYTEPARIDAVISFYGPTHLVEGWNEPPNPDPLKIRGVLEALFGGPPADMQRVYDAASPITYVSRRVPPTLLVYGASRSRRRSAIRARAGRKAEGGGRHFDLSRAALGRARVRQDSGSQCVGDSSIYRAVPRQVPSLSRGPDTR